MGTKRMTLVAAVLGTVAAAGMMGCNQGKAKDKGGAASVSVNALSISDVATVTVSVQGGGMGSPLVVPLVKKGTQFSALVSDLPVGTDYAFTASAKDGSAVELYHGGVTAQTIVKNQTANIVIDMNQVAPPVSLYDEAPVIAGLTETASCVSKGDTVTIKATAYDPDAGDTAGMAWSWTVDNTCGTLSAPVNVAGTSQASPGTSTVVFTATASSANCQVNLTIADARQPAVLMTTGSVTISIGDACAFGNAQITAIPNTCPVVANIGAVVGPVPGDGTPSHVPMVVGQSTFVTVSATDADNDTLLYSWSSPDCAGGTPTTSYGNWNDSTAKAGTWFLLTSAPPSGTCTFLVHVSDGTFADGTAKCDIVNHLSLPVKGANDVVKGNPVFGYDYQSTGTVNDGDTVKLEIVAPTTGCDTAYNLVWNPTGTALTTLDPPFTTGITLTAPSGAGTNGETVTVTATCPSSGLQTVHSFVLIGTSAVCNGAADGTVCTSTAQLTDKCVTLAKCAGGLCVAQTSVTCPASTVACQDNVCGHTTDGLCHLQNSSDGTGCSDGLACTTGDKCGAGVCGGTAVPCTPSSNPCQVNACVEPSGTCVLANKTDGTVCDDHNGCTGQSTLPPTTGIANPDICTGGVCGGAAVTCTGTLVCTSQGDDTHTCDPKVCMAGNNYAKKWVPPFSGMGVSATGTPWAAGQIYNPFDFGSGTVTSSGSADIYLTQLNAATGLASQAFTFGDTGGKDQVALGVAVASSGNVGMIGYFTGEIDFTANNSDGSGPSQVQGTAGLDYLQNSSLIPFYAVFDGASTGAYVTPKAAHMVNVGTGSLLSVGSNPGQNAIAICGKTSIAVPLSTNSKGVITGGAATAGGGMDIVVAKIDASTGAVIWGKQFGGAGDQVCEAVTVDNNGDVIITGNYNGTLTFGSTTFPAADSSTAILFVAKLKGADGTALAAASWGTAGRSDAYGVTVDGSNNIVIAGSIGAAVDMGGGVSMSYAGLTDAFAAKLTTALVPVWARAFGDVNYDQKVKSVGVSSSGDVYIGGNFEGSLGALGLTASANTALDAFDAQLSGVDGSPLCANAYGDAAGTQGITSLTVARTATGALANSIMIGGGFSSDMMIGNFDLNTGSPGLSASFIARLTP